MKKLTLFLCLFSFVFQLQAQEQEKPSPILFIYDASGSMWGKMGNKTKKEIASDVLSSAVNNLPENQNVGLMAYGHRKKGDCRDVEMLVELNNDSKTKVNTAVKGITPLGKTPLAFSAIQAINSLKDSKIKATIILITDGEESCDGNICEVVKAAKAEGIDFKLHIVGFGLKEGDTEQLKCAAKAGDGQYYDANDASGLSEVLNEATTETIDDPPGNFSVYAIKNGEPIDAWVKAYKVGTKEDVDMKRTYKDTTLLYLPPGKYDLEVNPLEGSDVAAITIEIESKADETGHQTVSFDAAKLQVKALNNGEGWDATVRVYVSSSGKLAAQTRTYARSSEMEINPGTYDLEFLALSNMKGTDVKHRVKGVKINAGEQKSVEHNFESGVAMIGVKSGEELVDATVYLKEVSSGTAIGGGRTYTSPNNNPKKFILNPGTYSVTITTLGKHKGKKETFSITVKAGETVEKIITY